MARELEAGEGVGVYVLEGVNDEHNHALKEPNMSTWNGKMEPDPSNRPTYTKSQLSAYFKHISLPKESQELSSNHNKLHHPPTALSFLTTLQQHTLCSVPFENLSLHYSPHHSISLDPQHLFRKIVQDARGGYCMENNCFFGTVLRSLGFEVHTAGARVNSPKNETGRETYEGWSHMVNIVTLADGRKYMLDVGFGGNGPVRPLPLHLEDSHVPGIEPAENRLAYRNIPQNSDPNQKLWVFQHRNDAQSQWISMYCFTELEFLAQDYEMMNFWTSQSRKSWFTQRIVAVRMIMKEGEVVGTVMLDGGEFKKRVKGVKEHLRTCESEEERVTGLEEWFGMVLREEERVGIRGMVSELKE